MLASLRLLTFVQTRWRRRYLPLQRPETARTRERIKELATPTPRKHVVPRPAHNLWDKKMHYDAIWCSPTLPQFGGTVYMCKLKIKLGYPVYCPFQIRDGGVYNLPFIRLDDILAQEAATEFKHNAQRRAANDAQRQQALNSRLN